MLLLDKLVLWLDMIEFEVSISGQPGQSLRKLIDKNLLDGRVAPLKSLAKTQPVRRQCPVDRPLI